MSNTRVPSIRSAILLSILFLLALSGSHAQENSLPSDSSETWSVHFQFTGIEQYHGSFPASYSGMNSLSNSPETPFSVTTTLFIGRQLWEGGELYLDPEMSGGEGFSSTRGLAGFPNGEVYRVGDPKPKLAIARVFFRQRFSLGGTETENVSSDQNQIAGPVPARRLTFTVGRFGLTDIFDTLAFANEPRTQFMNWSVWGAGAWDYAADTRGYTWGLAAQLEEPQWTLNLAAVMVPTTANGPDFDTHLSKAYSLNVEFIKHVHWIRREGKIHSIVFLNHANMGDYRQAIADANATGKSPDVTQTRSYCSKVGLVLGVEQPVSESVGLFGRISWNDGKKESWMFTEIERSVQMGMQFRGKIWGRDGDIAGAAYVANALSNDHRDYLALGGYGFIIGDGRLNYGLEHILELYYSAQLVSWFSVSLDNQLIVNPAYNRDRGPVVDAVAIRAHVEF